MGMILLYNQRTPPLTQYLIISDMVSGISIILFSQHTIANLQRQKINIKIYRYI